MTTYYHKPGAIARAFNRVLTFLFARGVGPSKNIAIEHIGRRSGKTYSTAVNIVEYEGQRYLVAPRGNTEWVRNIRAAGGAATLKHGKPEPVTLIDVPEPERAPILRKYLGENAMSTKASFGIDPKSPLDEFVKVSGRHPVFRITPKA
jgi:deazaflavin-dependent oxidoreductase (nitroreductase family)